MNTHVFNLWCDEPPGPTYMCIPFNGKDNFLYKTFRDFAAGLPSYWHWNITYIYTGDEMVKAVESHRLCREANERA